MEQNTKSYIKPINAVKGPSIKDRNPMKFDMIKINEIDIPLACRPTLDDPILMRNIFEQQEYLLPIENFKPKFIIDCGANVGYSAIYFAHKYPEAKIVAIEPESYNFRLLRYNTILYDNIECIKSGIWDKETYIKVVDKYNATAGFTTEETTAEDSDAIKTITINKILEDSGFNMIDLLKVDIESAEKEVFEAEANSGEGWLSKVKVLVIELHDRVKRGCSNALFRAISKYDYFFAFRGENLIFIREDLLNIT